MEYSYSVSAGLFQSVKMLSITYEHCTKLIYGTVINIAMAVSWVGSTQFSQSTYSNAFNAPFFNIWFSTVWMILCYPIFALILRFAKGKSFYNIFKHSQEIFGKHGVCMVSVFTRGVPFLILWAVTNYMYVRALGTIAASDVTALFSSCTVFVYLFSIIILKEELYSLRLIAVALTLGGVVLLASEDGFLGPSVLGVILSIVSAIGAALYKVSFKWIIGDASLSQVSLFLSILGLLDLLVMWPIMLTLYFTGLEQFDWYNLPWGFLCGSAVLGLAFNFLVNFGIAFTFPLFISVGTVLGIPLNAGVDAMFRGRIFGVTKIIATIMIIVGFILVLIPTDKCCGGRAITISQGMSDSQSKTGEKKKLLDKECRSDTNTRL
ncbi:unnamed protein product [Owenia fusiformis]|uniref:EamA domain-containing protein n=1 Tax=Owenia fusiformis TaxID=6347 RepID=A0A8S4PGJ1_OWEFU|nr:unnamed protein product [Owenia fusiformis]